MPGDVARNTAPSKSCRGFSYLVYLQATLLTLEDQGDAAIVRVFSTAQLALLHPVTPHRGVIQRPQGTAVLITCRGQQQSSLIHTIGPQMYFPFTMSFQRWFQNYCNTVAECHRYTLTLKGNHDSCVFVAFYTLCCNSALRKKLDPKRFSNSYR